MVLTPGTRLGPYEILSALGAGGMGEVYLARDTRLDRAVAVKVLPADTSADASARARFEREARAIAALSHPHICTVHDVGRHDDTDYLVMEYLDGETLADRLTKAGGPLPLEQVLTISIAIADALDKAHRSGIVHRDLKPANVMLTKSGPKLLDFGLAKLRGLSSPLALSGETATTTISGPVTATGTILGTLHYMAPEQVEGHEADARSDIWALGTLIYEMATGQRPFGGASPASLIGAILKDAAPALSTRQPLTPPALERLVRKCLMKAADERWQSAKDLHDELEWIRDSALGPAALPVPFDDHSRRRWAFAAAAILVVGALAVSAVRYLREGLVPLPALFEMRTEIVTPATDYQSSFALSPDGRQIVFVASGDGPSRLWLRSLEATTAQPLAGTEGAVSPFWSPDSRSVGFFANGRLNRIDLGSGAPRIVAVAGDGRGGTWGADGVILFTPSTGDALFRVSASGGPVVAVTTRDRQSSHRYPFFLSDGRHFLFLAQGAPDTAGIYLGSLDSAETRRLTPADAAGVYVSSGWVLWGQTGTLVAQRLDLERQALTGDPITLAEAVTVDAGGGSPMASVSAAGLVAYRAGGSGRRQLLWVDRSGQELGALGGPDADGLRLPRVSPDGLRVAVTRTVLGNSDIWLLDGARASRLTFDAAQDRYPVWSPDGRRIVFESNRTGQRNMYQKSSSGAGVEELLVTAAQSELPFSWSADGRFLLYSITDSQTNADIWALPMQGDRTPFVFLKTPFRETYERFSPDGRLVAYQSDESGRPEIYIRSFLPHGAEATGVEGQWQVSTVGGISPVWRPDGKELYYLNPSGAMMAASVAVTGSTLTLGAPVTLFSTHVYGGGGLSGQGPQYDVAPNGRFLINSELGSAAPITLLQNWNPEGKK